MVGSKINIPKDMLDAINDYKERCNKHIDDFTSNLNEPPATIYHYTDCSGLLGILESGKIWLTDIYSLNDPSEVRHGVKQAFEILEAESRQKHPALKFLAERIINKINEVGIETAALFFVACFSDIHKDLGQWRAYGDNGSGFSIGFDGNLLKHAFEKQNGENVPIHETFPITYDDELLRKIYKQIMVEVLPLSEMPEGRGLNNATINKFMNELAIPLSISILRTALFFKHTAYKNEKEHRFLQTRSMEQPVDDLRYRARLNSVLRFTELDWKIEGQHLLREIVIGPAADENQAKLSAKNCLRAGGIDPDKVNIHKSRIPYRNT